MNVPEKFYNTIRTSGIIGVVTGIVTITVGVAAGVMMIISGARLLLGRKDVVI